MQTIINPQHSTVFAGITSINAAFLNILKDFICALSVWWQYVNIYIKTGIALVCVCVCVLSLISVLRAVSPGSSVHARPPFCGGTHTLLRISTPPQPFEQFDHVVHADQCPSTVQQTHIHISSQSKWSESNPIPLVYHFSTKYLH